MQRTCLHDVLQYLPVSESPQRSSVPGVPLRAQYMLLLLYDGILFFSSRSFLGLCQLYC